MNEKLPRAGGKKRVWLRTATYEKLRAAAERAEVALDPTQFEMIERAGRKFYRYRGAVGGVSDGRGGGGGGRFVPRIGGEGSTKLFVSNGSVAYCRVSQQNTVVSTPDESVRVVPITPRIDGVPLDAEEPPSFEIGGKTGGALWLKVDRLRCPADTLVPAEDSTETEELVLLNRGQKPARKTGELHLLLCEMDFETGDGGAKTITNLDAKWQCDFPVWFVCEEDASRSRSEEPSDFESSDLNSSDNSDPNDTSSDGSSDDCEFTIKADWMAKLECYDKGTTYIITWKVGVGIQRMASKCASWKVKVAFDAGTPRPAGGQSMEGNWLIQPMSGGRLTFYAKFRFPAPPPKCSPAALTVTLVGTPISETSADPCCKSHTKSFPEKWPRHCGENCRTTVLPPP